MKTRIDVIKVTRAFYYRYIALQDRYCSVCRRMTGGFVPFEFSGGSRPAVLHNLEVIGSDLDNYECPRCGSSDRERHLLLYLQAANLINALRGADVLHFAPERRLAAFVSRLAPTRYVKCDLIPNSDGVIPVDLQSMPFHAKSFDFIIANHVLEHVMDFNAAGSEITRVLKPGGLAILQTPFSNVLTTTFSDPGITDEKNREEYYGQADHVRLFGRDVFARITEATQMECRVRTHDELLSNIDAKRYAVNASEPFFLFQKRA